MDLLDQLDIIKNIIDDKYSNIINSYYSKRQSALFNLYMGVPESDAAYFAVSTKLWNEIKDNRLRVILDPQARKDARIASLLSYLGPSLCRLIYRIARR